MVMPAINLYTTNWCQWNDAVVGNTSEALDEIYDLFAGAHWYVYEYYTGPLVDEWPVYSHIMNWGNTTTQDLTLEQIDDSNSYHWFSTVLYVGHGYEYCYYGYSTNPNDPDDIGSIDKVWYGNISTHADDQPYQQFVFNWVCWGANRVGDGPPSNWGAPYDWNPLWWNNQASGADYCWIGFYNGSAWLSDLMGTHGAYPGTSGAPNIYKYWLVFFYYYALYGNNFDNNYNTIHQALDMASWDTGYLDYGHSILATGFNVTWPYTPITHGNGYMHVSGDPTGLYLPADYVQFLS